MDTQRETELDKYRVDCLDALMYVTLNSKTMEPIQECAKSYRIASDAHTIEYLNNNPEFCNFIYKK